MKSYEKMFGSLEKKKKTKSEIDEIKDIAETFRREIQHGLDYMKEVDEMKPSNSTQPVSNSEKEDLEKYRISKKKLESLRSRTQVNPQPVNNSEEEKDELEKYRIEAEEEFQKRMEEHRIAKEKLEAMKSKPQEEQPEKSAEEINDELNKAMMEVLNSINTKNKRQDERDDDDER